MKLVLFDDCVPFNRDIFSLFLQPKLVEDVFTLFENHLRSLNTQIDAIIGLESRGFLIGPSVALRLNKPFIPIRKAGKLPGKVKAIVYKLEYGYDKFEVQEQSILPGMKCVIVDDLLATGGSLDAAIQLVEQCSATVVECDVIIELSDLKGKDKFTTPVYSLVKY